MTSMVDMIEMAKQNIVELEEMAKKNAKALAALLQEKDDIDRDLSVNRKIVDDLSTIRENKIQVVMAEKPKPVTAEIKTGLKPKTPLYAVDEKDEIIAEYASTVEAARDLKIAQSSVSVRLRNYTVEQQIDRYGYALVLKEKYKKTA